jgi:hypothetical protein
LTIIHIYQPPFKRKIRPAGVSVGGLFWSDVPEIQDEKKNSNNKLHPHHGRKGQHDSSDSHMHIRTCTKLPAIEPGVDGTLVC